MSCSGDASIPIQNLAGMESLKFRYAADPRAAFGRSLARCPQRCEQEVAGRWGAGCPQPKLPRFVGCRREGTTSRSADAD